MAQTSLHEINRFGGMEWDCQSCDKILLVFSLEMTEIKAVFKKHILNDDLTCDPFKTFVITHFDDFSDVTESRELFLWRSCLIAR